MTATRNITMAICAAALAAGAASAQGYDQGSSRGREYQDRPSSYYYDYRGNVVAPRYETYAPPAPSVEPPADMQVPAPRPEALQQPNPEPVQLSGGPSPEPAPAQPYSPMSKAFAAGATAADIAMQPAKDIGVKKTAVPAVLASAQQSPYALADASNCAQMSVALRDLDEVLGADYAVERLPSGSRAGKIAEAGGRAVVNSIIPFRGIVREVTGAAAADRAMAAAIDAGIARRGFLRGLSTAQGCEPGAQASLGR